MRRVAAVLLMCFLLSACALSRTMETDEVGIRSYYQKQNELQQIVKISAEFSDRVSEYLVSYQHNRNGDCVVSVLEPESIAGVTVTLRNGETVLSAGDVRLETGRLDETGLTPISALPRLINVWENHPSGVESVKENGADCLLLVYDEETVSYRTVFSRETYLPIRAEVFCAGECVLRLQYVVEGGHGDEASKPNLGGDLSGSRRT